MSRIKHATIAILCIALLVAVGPANAQECSELFRTEFSRSRQSASDFFREVARFSDPASFSSSFSSGTEGNAVFRDLVAAGVWHFSRMTVAKAPSVDRRVENWLAQVQQDALAETRYRILDQHYSARPRVMTGDERKLALEFGYGAIEGTNHPQTKGQRDRDALHAMLSQAQAAYAKRHTDEIQAAFSRMMRISSGEALISKAQVYAILKNPVEFAIVYAQMNGLVYHAGEPGMMLSALVPWAGRLDKASLNSLRMIAMMARASVFEAAELHRIDNLVLETLRLEFAPHLDPFK